jgi:hypothetical protein
MEMLPAALALLASMVLVLSGMVGWIYWQQQRLFQNMNNIIAVIGELARPIPIAEPVAEPESDDEDDRVSVEDAPVAPVAAPAAPAAPADVVTGPTGPAPLDTDNLEDKTKKELQDILTKRGIPFSKADNKGALISLLKATA